MKQNRKGVDITQAGVESLNNLWTLMLVRKSWHRGRPSGGRDCCGGWCTVKHLVPVSGTAVAESPHTFPALSDVQGASRTRVRHGDLPQTVSTAAMLQLLLVVIL